MAIQSRDRDPLSGEYTLFRPFGDIVNCLYRNGNVIEYKQDPIPESKYHNQIQHDHEKASHYQDGEPDVRYWSDFNRLYYAPKTARRLPIGKMQRAIGRRGRYI
jgi:hypothetical protein